MAAKKRIRKPKLSKELTLSPEGLQEVWEKPEVREAWESLNDKYQLFLTTYLGNYRNARDAYSKTVNPQATAGTARNGGWRMLSNDNIGIILNAMREGRKRTARELIENTLHEAAEEAFKPVFQKDADGQTDMIEVPDYPTRIKAVEAMAKYEGFGGQGQAGINVNGGTANIQIVIPGKKEE